MKNILLDIRRLFEYIEIISRRKLLIKPMVIIFIIIIAGLSIFLHISLNNQTSLQSIINTIQNDINRIKDDNQKKQELLNKNLETIKKNEEKQTQLEKEINDLKSKNEELRYTYGGYSSSVVSANNAVYSSVNSYAPGNCTYGVKMWKPSVPNFLGNADNWDDAARSMGIPVDDNPTVGSVAQTDDGWAGHVLLVLKVNGGEFFAKEMNYGGLWNVREAWHSTSGYNFIHFA